MPFRLWRATRIICLSGALSTFFPLISASAEEASEIQTLLRLSLEELMDVEVFSAGKKPQILHDIPAAVFVISQDDIRRSGVTSLPELFRMVPGMIAGQLNGNSWAVSARGEADFFANKLLVMVDGRSVYLREFSGVLWRHLYPLLEDIERIEVIRGPGGALWGANAVNGIINIITKPAGETQGGLLSAAAGNEVQGQLALRHGGKLAGGGHYRVYAQGRRLQTPDAAFDDFLQSGQVGFRLDRPPDAGSDLSVQGAYYEGRAGDLDWSPASLPVEQLNTNGHLQAQWTRRLDKDRAWRLKTYYDYIHAEGDYADSVTHTLDLDVQYQFQPHPRHELVLGGNWRHYWNEALPRRFGRMTPANHQEHQAGVFAQDEITLAPRWRLTAGAKLEYNESADLAFQPSLRLLWTPAAQRSLWAAASRAARIPAWKELRGEYRLGVPDALNPRAPLPVTRVAGANPELDPEILWAYELGWREVVGGNLFFDLTAFHHRLTGLVGVRDAPPVLTPTGFEQFTQWENLDDLHYQGLELALDWTYPGNLHWQAAYTYLNPPASKAFQHQVSLRGHWRFAPAWGLNAWLYYHDTIPAVKFMTPVAASLNLDLNLAWQVDKNLELSLVGSRLLEDDQNQWHWQIFNRLVQPPARGVFGQARWTF